MIEKVNDKKIVIANEWSALKKFTDARIALGKTGVSVSLKEVLKFKMAHAHARDAVFSLLNIDELIKQLSSFRLPVYLLKSKAADKHIYLRRPDLGRQLSDDSVNQLSSTNITYDVSISITNGLSATAINNHAMQLLVLLIPMLASSNISIAPICLIENGRVAVADEAASLLNAKISIILIGERPGLSSPDSLGAYITYNPKVGLTDEARNCISNIRKEGLQYKQAADKTFYLIKEALRLKLSGVTLKENSDDTFKLS